MEACSLLANLRERNAELEWAAVSGEDRFVTTLITATKETMEFGKELGNDDHHIIKLDRAVNWILFSIRTVSNQNILVSS